MDNQLKDFFFYEQEQGHLVFEDDPEYQALLKRCLALFPGGDLPGPVFDLMEVSNCVSFAHGLGLGLRLRRWAQ